MKKTKVFIHIGVEKTGSTSIQHYMLSIEDKLKENQMLFPRSLSVPSNIALVAAFRDYDKIDNMRRNLGLSDKASIQDYSKKLKAEFLKEVEEVNATKIIISSEHYSSRLFEESEIKRLKDWFDPEKYDVKIIVYLRAQDELLISRYSTLMKNGYIQPLALPTLGKEQFFFHFDKLLALWANVFGKNAIIPRIYRKGVNIVEDFIEVTQILKIDDKTANTSNQALGLNGLNFLKEINAYIPMYIEGKLNPLRANLVPLVAKFPQKGKLKMNVTDLSAFMDRFKEGNRIVAKEYFNSEDIFPDTSNLHKKEKTHIVDINHEMMKIAAYLWNEKQQEIIELKEKYSMLKMIRNKILKRK